jgi:hypothetical protein
MVSRSSTDITPGAAHAAATAVSCSSQERTCPLSVTVPFEVEMVRSSASSLAFRENAFLILCSTSSGLGVLSAR